MSFIPGQANVYYICRYGDTRYGVIVADHYKRVIINEANGTYRDASGQTDQNIGYSRIDQSGGGASSMLAEIVITPGSPDTATAVVVATPAAPPATGDDALFHIAPRNLVQPFTHWIFYLDAAETMECGDVKRNDSTYVANRQPNTPDPGGAAD